MLTVTDLTYRLGARPLFDSASASCRNTSKSALSGATAPARPPCFGWSAARSPPKGGTFTSCRATHAWQGRAGSDGRRGQADRFRAGRRSRTRPTCWRRPKPRRTRTHRRNPRRASPTSRPMRPRRAPRKLSRVSALTKKPASGAEGVFGRVADARGAGRRAVCAPDLLLLDEPTNYLDLEGTLWLIEYLRPIRRRDGHQP